MRLRSSRLRIHDFLQCPSCNPRVLVEDRRQDASYDLLSKRRRARDCWHMCAPKVIPPGFEPCLPSAGSAGLTWLALRAVSIRCWHCAHTHHDAAVMMITASLFGFVHCALYVCVIYKTSVPTRCLTHRALRDVCASHSAVAAHRARFTRVPKGRATLAQRLGAGEASRN